MPTVDLVTESVIAIVVGGVPTWFAVNAARKRGKTKLIPRSSEGAKGERVVGALLALALAVTVYGSFVEPRLLQVGRANIDLATPSNAAPRSLKVALISDTHLGMYRHEDWLRTVVRRINALHPDVVLVAGDIASTLSGTGEFKPFRELQSRYGTYAVLGNWDYRAGAVDVRKALGSQGVKLLVNRSVTFDVDGRSVSVIGLDDVTYGRPDIDAAMGDVPPDAKKIILAHNPDAAVIVEAHGADLVLAGHTHAGQVRLPGVGPVPHMPTHIGQQFDKGLFHFGMTRLFITPGVGESGSRARLFNPPEISLLTISF